MSGEYRTVLADPPWARSDAGHHVKPRKMTTGDRVTSVNRGWGHKSKKLLGDHYPVLELDAILALEVETLAADSAHLWLWSLNSTMEQAYRVVREWGFTPIGLVTWKKNSYGMGYYMRLNSEQLIFAVRGKREMPDTAWLGTVIESARGRHSEKPDLAYDLIEHVSPEPRVELFARKPRLGWECWGNEVDSTVALT